MPCGALFLMPCRGAVALARDASAYRVVLVMYFVIQCGVVRFQIAVMKNEECASFFGFMSQGEKVKGMLSRVILTHAC